jgi:hypothetical protein
MTSFTDSPVPQRPMTPEEVLAFFAALDRELGGAGGDGSRVPIGFETTIADWRGDAPYLWNDLALSESRWLHKTLNAWFRTSATHAQWREALEPEETRTLRGLCEFIASQATVAAIRPVTVLGQPSLAAGAFLAVRSALARAGVKVGRLRPSTPLGPLLKRQWGEVFIELNKLAPGKLPKAQMRHAPIVRVFGWTGLVGLAMLLLCLVPGIVNTAGVGIVVAGLAMFVVGTLGVVIAPSFAADRVELPGLHTVGDLCRALIS